MTLGYVPMWHEYFQPANISDAIKILDRFGSTARIIAGGTDLVLALQERKMSPIESVVDISSIPELLIIKNTVNRVEIGSCVTLSSLIHSEMIQRSLPLLAYAAQQIAGPQIRNIATLGGNIVNASPAADMAPPLLVYEAIVRIISRDGNIREVPLSRFFKSYRQVDLKPGEVVSSFCMNIPSDGTRGVFYKVQPRRSMAIATLNLAILLKVEAHTLQEIRIAMGAVAPIVVRLSNVERALTNKPVEIGLNKDAYAGINDDINPIDDFRASRRYRLQVARNLLQEQVLEILGLQVV